LLYVCYKVLTNILHTRQVLFAGESLGDYQWGFRNGRSTTDSLFILRCILKTFYEYNLDMHLLLIEFIQAYGSTNRTYLYEILKESGIPKTLVNLIKNDVAGFKCKNKNLSSTY
jgi:sorting nexin-29